MCIIVINFRDTSFQLPMKILNAQFHEFMTVLKGFNVMIVYLDEYTLIRESFLLLEKLQKLVSLHILVPRG